MDIFILHGFCVSLDCKPQNAEAAAASSFQA
jgi:hypothetical protein